MEIVIVLLALAAGACLGVQAGVNAGLARIAGLPEWAAFVNFAVGLVALAIWLVARRAPLPAADALLRGPAWIWTGGVLGAFYVSGMSFAAPRLGVAVALALSVSGQLGAALVVDATGALGLAARPVTPARIAGAGLLVVAVVLMRR